MMNKLTKFLAFVGLSSAVAYVAYGLKGKKTPLVEKASGPSPDHKASKHEPDTKLQRDGQSQEQTSSSDARTQKMYKNLSMTEEQQRQYERDYRTLMGTWEKTNPGKKIGDQQEIDEQDQLLKAVLNEDQYAIYRDQFKDHRA